MKLFILGASVALADKPAWLKKEWEVQDAHFADQEIILSDPTIRKRFDIVTIWVKNGNFVNIFDDWDLKIVKPEKIK